MRTVLEQLGDQELARKESFGAGADIGGGGGASAVSFPWNYF